MARKPTRQRGEIEARASGSLRVRVYAGVDALTGRRHYLTASVPAGPKAYAEAEKIRRRLVNQVDEQRNPRTKATVNQLMGRYLAMLDVEETTKQRYEDVIGMHVIPLLRGFSERPRARSRGSPRTHRSTRRPERIRSSPGPRCPSRHPRGG